MSKTNCINCGAAKDVDDIKCPFCGTTYLDLTAIDFESGKPVVCQFVLPNNIRIGNSDGRVIMSMLAIPMLEEISQTANTIDVTGYGGRHLFSFVANWDVNVGVSFKPIARRSDNALIHLRVEQGEEK